MTGSTPPRKGRGTAGAGGGDGLDDAWLVAEAAKRSHARAAVWGVSVRLRGHFNTFLLLVLVLLAFLAVSIGSRSGNGGAPQAPSTLSVTTKKVNGPGLQAPSTLSVIATNKVNGVEPVATTTLSATKKKVNDVELQAPTPTSSFSIKKGNGAETKAPVTLSATKKKGNDDVELLLPLTPLPLVVTTKKGKGAEPREATTVLPPSNGTGGRGDPGECDMSSGRWVYDDKAYPLYKESACKFMSDQSACQKFGRTDLRYQHWRWQPHGCDLPRFDAVKLLRRLRNKRLAFVGDSLNRNQWVSLVCLIDTATPTLHKYMSGNGSLVAFRIHEYNASVEFYWSPLLVESNSDHPVHHRIADRVVRAGSIAKHARRWNDADVLVFNSYLWWRRPSMKILWGSSFEAAAGHSRAVYEVTDGLRAFELAINTWAEWLERHVDRARTRLFFTSMSPTHLHSDEWAGPASGGAANHRCLGETEPIPADPQRQYRGRDTDPAFARAVEAQVRRLGARGVAVRVLNVTQLSEHRKDAHPSVHRRQWDPPTEARERDPSSDADCIHWCLPGVPDVWNQMLYAHLVPS